MNQNNHCFSQGQALISIFSQIKDPRIKGRCLHSLIDIIVIAICAIICGAQHWNEMAEFGRQRISWLKQFIELPHGIPSHQTFCRVFSLIPPEELLACFIEWTTAMTPLDTHDIIAIDGKTLRKSHHKAANQEALHLVNVYATNQGITLAAMKIPDKSNEIKAIPPLLKSLNVSGSVITMDAMGTQKGIANLIILRGANYVLALKKNHKRFYKKVENLFVQAKKMNYQAMVYKTQITHDYDHSRYETREYSFLPMMYLHCQKQFWKGLQTFIQVKSTRYIGSVEHTAIRYYISSLPLKNDLLITKAIRNHWHVENRLHWKLDVGMQEDACRIYKANAAENFSILRKLVLQLLDRTPSQNGVRYKRWKAALNVEILQKVIGF